MLTNLNFFSIKVDNGPLTSQLQHLNVGDEILLSTKPTGTLTSNHLLTGRNLYLISTGTGLAPFISIIQDPDVYDRFDKIILTHGVRNRDDLAYQSFIEQDLLNNPYFGDTVKQKLIYYPTVTRDTFTNQGRITDLLVSGKLSDNIGLDAINPEHDRFMLCGSPGLLKDMKILLDEQGFEESRFGKQASYVIERAFVEK